MAELTRARPKVRSRSGGAAVPLDDLDRRLLNLMQGRFPLEPRPYAAVAREAEIGEDEAMERVRRLLEQRIIREITPIYDTRALGYSSMLVAAKVDSEHPQRAAQVINEHPGVSHNYLRNHEFNLWFTLAVEEGSRLGLQGTLDVQEGADAVMVKPALPYLDVIRRVRDATDLPVAAYNVSGEYAMVRAAAAAGYLDERAAVLEALTGIRRAGADILVTYHAKDVARWLQ